MSSSESIGPVELGEPMGGAIGSEIGPDAQAGVVKGPTDELNHLPISKVDTWSKHMAILGVGQPLKSRSFLRGNRKGRINVLPPRLLEPKLTPK